MERKPRRRTRRGAVRPRLLWALLLALLVVAAGCSQEKEPKLTGRWPAGGFIRAEGRALVIDSQPVGLQAVNFSNLYHRDLTGAELLSSPHHSEADFARVTEMGFNSIRFAFDGDWWADDPAAFWKWLDQNVAWAKQHDLRLVLTMYTPAGGYSLDPTSSTADFDFWSDARSLQHNVDLWRAIAARYKDEPAIAAYELLNAPVTLDSDGDQWKKLVQEMVDAVRTVDRNHLVVVDALSGLKGRYGTDGVAPHFLIDDDNVLYGFHFYEPVAFTHQDTPWADGPTQHGSRYPDPDVIVRTGERVLLRKSAISTPSLPSGTTDWRLYDSGVVPIKDDSAVAAMPVAVTEGGLRGTALFDAITVTEYDPSGVEVRVVVNAQLDADDTPYWSHWETGRGTRPARFASEASGHQDGGSLSITDAWGGGAIAGWSNDDHLFTVVPGNQYRIRGYMRGRDVVAPDDGAHARLRLDVYASSPGAPAGGFMERDKAYLEHELLKHVQFGMTNNVPVALMEFGVARETFKTPGAGGERWMEDVLSLLDDHGLSYAYWEYHGNPMGIFLDETARPKELNLTLRDLLLRHQG
jgi:endoglucanase